MATEKIKIKTPTETSQLKKKTQANKQPQLAKTLTKDLNVEYKTLRRKYRRTLPLPRTRKRVFMYNTKRMCVMREKKIWVLFKLKIFFHTKRMKMS